MVRENIQIEVRRFDQRAAHGDVVEHRDVPVKGVSGASGAVEGEVGLELARVFLFEKIDKGAVARHRSRVGFLHRHFDLAGVGDVGIVSHETGKGQVRRILLDGIQDRRQLFRLGKAAPVKAHVDFQIEAHPQAEFPGKGAVLPQPLFGIDEPLHLTRRIEGRGRIQLGVESAGGGYGKGLSKQYVCLGQFPCNQVEVGAMEDHGPMGFRMREDVTDQRNAGKRLGHHPVGAPGGKARQHGIQVAVEKIQVHHHHRVTGPLPPQQGIDPGEIRIEPGTGLVNGCSSVSKKFPCLLSIRCYKHIKNFYLDFQKKLVYTFRQFF